MPDDRKIACTTGEGLLGHSHDRLDVLLGIGEDYVSDTRGGSLVGSHIRPSDQCSGLRDNRQPIHIGGAFKLDIGLDSHLDRVLVSDSAHSVTGGDTDEGIKFLTGR